MGGRGELNQRPYDDREQIHKRRSNETEFGNVLQRLAHGLRKIAQ